MSPDRFSASWLESDFPPSTRTEESPRPLHVQNRKVWEGREAGSSEPAHRQLKVVAVECAVRSVSTKTKLEYVRPKLGLAP